MNFLSTLWDRLSSAVSQILVFAAGPKINRALGSYMSRTGGDWIDATVVAETMRLSRKAARARLDKAVEQGTLDKFFLYMGDDAPAPIVIEEAEIGTLIRLGDIGFIDEADTEIKLRRIKTEAVYCVRAAV